VVLVLATAGQGEDCANAKKFTEALHARKTGLPGALCVAVFGLGDSNYWGKGSADSAKYFCLPAKRAMAKLLELGARALVLEAGLGDDQDDDGYEQALHEWEAKLWAALGVVPKAAAGGAGAPPHVDDDIKIKSNFLRGTIAEGLADLSTGKLVFEDTKITKFHGIYQQDDRDLRDGLDSKGVERAYSFMIRIGVPGGVATAEQYLQMDDLCSRYATGNIKVTTRQVRARPRCCLSA
jgi:sulfite reductase (NADPH) hemoprotein beta-component